MTRRQRPKKKSNFYKAEIQSCAAAKSIASLLRTIGTVAGVAETWQNVGVAVQPLVDRREPDRNVRVNAAHTLNAFRRAEKAYQSNVVLTALFQPVDRGDGGVRRCQHGRDHDRQPLVQIARRLEEIFHRNEGFR